MPSRSSRPPSVRSPWWWVFDPRLSLRAHATLIVGGGAALLIVLVTWSTGLMARRQIERQLGPAFETLALQVSDKLDRSLQDRQRQLQFLATLEAFRGDRGDDAERRRILSSALDAAPDVAWVGFIAPNGEVTLGTQGLFEKESVEATAWFRNANENPFVSEPHELPDLGRSIVDGGEEGSPRFLTVAVPVRSPAGRFAGVLAAHVRWTLAREIRLSVVPEAARREHIGVTIYGANADVLLDSAASGWSAPPPMPAVPEGRRLRGSLVESTPEGAHYVLGYARNREHRGFRGFAWLVAVRQPADDAFLPVRQLQRSVFGVGFVFAALFAIGSWLAAGRLSRRMASIAAAAHRIREGDVLTVMPQPHDESEMAHMSSALGEMVEELRTKQAQPAAPPPSETRPW